jgi:C_GCAxxG_C_C family probable redox protein
MNDVQTTLDLLANGFNCSQAILTVFGGKYGLDGAAAKMLGRSLGGGMGHLARTCGAVTAAVLVLGLATDSNEEGDARKAVESSVQVFFRRFEELHGTTECKDLLGADMSTEAGMKKFREEGLFRKRCPIFVKTAAGIVANLVES